MREQEIRNQASSETTGASIRQYYAVIIANPTSGSYARSAHEVEDTLAFLQQAGWQVDLLLTEAVGDICCC
jgi:diacylglycerol kinase (ATP)